jgi:hypothetical protein
MFFLYVRDQVSHTYRTKGKITVLYILIAKNIFVYNKELKVLRATSVVVRNRPM